MKEKLKGGIDSIVGLVILVGLVIAGIIVAIVPLIDQGEDLASTATSGMSGLQSIISK